MIALPIDPSIITDLPAISAAAISPPGAHVAYVRALPDPRSGEARSWIELAPFAAGRPPVETRALTAGPRDRAPAWSPDGSRIAFLRTDRADAPDAPPQVWTLPAHGGEATRATSLPLGVASFTWTPDGAGLVLVADVDPDAAAGDGDAVPPAAPPRVRRVERIYFRADGIGWRGNRHRQLFHLDLATGTARQLTRGDFDAGSPAVSPDGATVAFSSSDRSSARERRLPGVGELCVVPLAGGRVERRLRGIPAPGPIAWSPDGRRIAFARGGDGAFYGQGHLWVVDADGGEARRLTDDSVSVTLGVPPIAEPPALHWSGDEIVFLADARGSSGIFAADAAATDAPPRALRHGREVATALSVTADGRRAAITASTLTRPPEVTGVDLERGRSREVTRASAPYLQARPPARTERFRVRRGDVSIDCWLTFPPDFDESRRYPLVLEIHGGPHGFYGNGWYPLHQVIAGAGSLVLWANPRGSATYGQDFMHRVMGDWAGEDAEDLMAALDRVVARPYVDEARLGVHGYSYGGYMTASLIARTDRFRAAVVGAPVIDLVSMYGTTDIAMVFGETEWGGTPWANRDHYLERSPLTHAPNVRTPVLLLHGEEDVRCPISQSEQYYVALKRLGREVEFVRFPGAFHGFPNTGHPHLRRAYLEHVVEWFGRHLG